MKKEIQKYKRWKLTYAPRAADTYPIWLGRFDKLIKNPHTQDVNDIVKYTDYLKANFHPKSLQYALVALRDFAKFEEARGIKFLSPSLIKIPKVRQTIRPATDENITKKMLDLLPTNEFHSLRDHILVRIMAETGCRISELLSITFKTLDNNKALVPTRKRESWRYIYWSNETDRLLFEKYIPIRINLSDKIPNLFISHSNRGIDNLTTRSVQRMVKGLRERLGLDKVTPHSFRHGRALSIIDHSEGKIEDVAFILGHKNIQSSMAYLNLSKTQIERRAKKYVM